jgi:hypothetical protein
MARVTKYDATPQVVLVTTPTNPAPPTMSPTRRAQYIAVINVLRNRALSGAKGLGLSPFHCVLSVSEGMWGSVIRFLASYHARLMSAYIESIIIMNVDNAKIARNTTSSHLLSGEAGNQARSRSNDHCIRTQMTRYRVSTRLDIIQLKPT